MALSGKIYIIQEDCGKKKTDKDANKKYINMNPVNKY